MNLEISLDECKEFPGGWSVCPEFMFQALSHVAYDGQLRVLEIGGGRGTLALWQLLDAKRVPAELTTYENNATYLPELPSYAGLSYRLQLWQTWPTALLSGPYDLVIVDGPNGVVREKWYPLLRSVVRPGTILAVDDFGHYAEFGKALDANFQYDLVAEKNPEVRRGITWKIVQLR